MPRKSVYKVGWKAPKGFKYQSFWTKKPMEKKVRQLKKQGKFYRAWKAGESKPIYKS